MQKTIGAVLLATVTLAACADANQDPPLESRELVITVATPNPCWSVELREVYRRADTLLVVSRMIPPPPGMACAQVIATATARASAELPDLPVQYLLLGKSWGWGEDAGFEAISDQASLKQRLGGAELLMRLPESQAESRPGKPVL